MKPSKAIKSGLTKYATFTGRATTSEFWWCYFAFALIQNVAVKLNPYAGFAVWAILVIPVNAVAVRRMNDQEKSGWLIVTIGVGITVLQLATPSLETLNFRDPQQAALLITQLALQIFGFSLLIGESAPQTQKLPPNPNEVPQ